MMDTAMILAPWIGSACCCFAFFVLLIVVAALMFRSKKASPEAIAGLPPAPAAGVQTHASLTRLEDERKRVAPAEDIPPPAPPAEDEYGSTMVIDRNQHPEFAPPPPPPFASGTVSPNRPRFSEPQPTIVADDSGPLPPKGTRNG
jgi:hypothetical protein